MLRYVKRNDTHTDFERPEDMPPALHRLLMSRGIRTPEEARAFLHPDAADLLDPFLLNDMDRAVPMIREAMAQNDPICVYGDYDVDGVCASAIMKLWLQSQGANVEVYLPSRHREGYGLNADAIREIAGRAKLLVTVDCGVSSVEHVALARSLGLQVIVTDHHLPGEALPDCPVVDPVLNGYPFPYLCGAGVAWKLVWALSGEMPMALIDLAALATVADVVSLTGENRIIVTEGLRRINAAPRPGIAALIEAAKLSGEITSGNIAFQLAPRLNAGGRLETAYDPLALVTAEDAEQARPLAEKLDAKNRERRGIELDILKAAEEQLRDFDFVRHRAIILAGKGWNPGVIGLVASRLVERYHYPTVMLSDQGDKLTGSCRSIEGVDIHAALAGCADTLTRFGGHKQAAGLTLDPARLEEFIDAMDAWLTANIPPEVYIPVKTYDAELDMDDVTLDLVEALKGMQPTGEGNPPPIFRAAARVETAKAVGAEGAHLRMELRGREQTVAGIFFGEGRRARDLRENDPVDVLFEVKLNSYRGLDSAEMALHALLETRVNARAASNLDDELPLQCDFLTEIIYNKKIDLAEPPSVKPIDEDGLAALLNRAPQGTLILAGDMATAMKLQALGPCDLFMGRLPDDPRAFNAVCVCPRQGDIPQSNRRVALAGCPEEWLGSQARHFEYFRVAARPEWTRLLPDRDDMLAIYRALMTQPPRYDSLRQLSLLMANRARESAKSPRDVNLLAAQLSLLVMEHAGLFDYGLGAPGRPVLTRTDVKKINLEDDDVWRTIQGWRAIL